LSPSGLSGPEILARGNSHCREREREREGKMRGGDMREGDMWKEEGMEGRCDEMKKWSRDEGR
jgi:hypothetical protein